MADRKDKAQQGKQDVLDQGGGQQADQNRQSGNAGSGSQSRSGQTAGRADEGEAHNSQFLHSSPEANVFPAGSKQADNSTRSRGGDSAAGTPDEGRLGGSGGTSAPGTTGNDPDR